MKRFFAILVLSAMIVSSVAPFFGAKEEFETESITVQEELLMENLPIDDIPQITYIEEKEEKSELEIALENMNADIAVIESITDKKAWFIAYKEIIEKYSYILDMPETIYDYFTEEEIELFFSVVQAEIGDEYSFEQKCNVASVILNRIDHEKFGNTMTEVLTADQFYTIANGSYKKVDVSESTILACEYAFMIEDTTNGCLFFDSNNALSYVFAFNDGAHNFYVMKGE